VTWIKLEKGYVHKNVLCDCELSENLRNGSHTLHMGINEFVSLLSVYCPIWVKFGIKNLNIMLLESVAL
jgi:hypothetical protein